MKNFNDLNEEEFKLVTDIAERSFGIINRAIGYSNTYSVDTMIRVLAIVHLNSCKLDLKRMLAASDLDLVHDMGGILCNINGALPLKNCFLPRFADLS